MFKTFSKKIYDKIYAVRENGKPFLKYFSVNDYKGLLTDDFSIKSSDNETINGKYIYKENHRKNRWNGQKWLQKGAKRVKCNIK